MFAASSDDTAIISRKITRKHELLTSGQLEDAYEIAKCVHWAKNNNFSKVALQFPDSLLIDASRVALQMQETLSNIYILADTTYTSCCVDEIGAEHVNAEAIIHFGNACLSATNRLPVFYVFPKYPIDLEKAAVQITNMFHEDCKPKRIIILYDIGYTHSMISLKTSLEQEYDEVIISKLKLNSNAVVSNLDPNLVENNTKSTDDGSTFCAGGRVFKIADGCSGTDYVKLYIGGEGPTCDNLMLALNGCQFFTYNPILGIGQKESSSNRMILRRNYLIEKARDASTVGILVGTLAIVSVREVIEHIRNIGTLAGKKVYTLFVGKPNPAKLANFPEIDIFVYVTCPETSLIDCKEYYRPIITPYEFQVAYNHNPEWASHLTTDFDKVLSGFVAAAPDVQEGANVSLITGRIQRVVVSESTSIDETAVVERNRDMSIAQVHQNGEYLTSRTWKGLDPLIGQTPASVLTEGQHGIASHYEKENSMQ